MSLVSLTRRTAQRLLPTPAFNKLKELKQLISPLDLTAPVLQIYINDGEISSHVCINNFYSFLAPSVDTKANLEIAFFDTDGHKILNIREQLAQFQSRFVDVRQTLAAHKVNSSLGTVTVQLRPIHPRRTIYKRFGRARHIFSNSIGIYMGRYQ